MRMLLKDGKFAGYEPRKDEIKKTHERKGRKLTEAELDKVYKKRLEEFEAMPNKGAEFVIKEKA